MLLVLPLLMRQVLLSLEAVGAVQVVSLMVAAVEVLAVVMDK